jgi:hypothetical protein
MAANDDAVAALALRVAALEMLLIDTAHTTATRSGAARADLTRSVLTSLEEAPAHERPALLALVQTLRRYRALSEDVLHESQAAADGLLPPHPLA